MYLEFFLGRGWGRDRVVVGTIGSLGVTWAEQ